MSVPIAKKTKKKTIRYDDIAAGLYQVLLRTPEKHRGEGWLEHMQDFERKCFGKTFEEMNIKRKLPIRSRFRFVSK